MTMTTSENAMSNGSRNSWYYQPKVPRWVKQTPYMGRSLNLAHRLSKLTLDHEQFEDFKVITHFVCHIHPVDKPGSAEFPVFPPLYISTSAPHHCVKYEAEPVIGEICALMVRRFASRGRISGSRNLQPPPASGPSPVSI